MPKKCECGCGGIVVNKGRRFLHGHNQKNKHVTPKSVAALVVKKPQKKMKPKPVSVYADVLARLEKRKQQIVLAMAALQDLE
jgi:RNase P/RNase MRP subunit p29